MSTSPSSRPWRDAKVKLVFLDACRDNPFAAKIRSAKATRSVAVNSGLAEMKSGEGTLIAFATGPGQTALDGEVGNHSPFTRALIANIAQPGVEIQQAMTKVRAQVNEETNKNQLPWGHTNLIGEVYLNPQAASADKPAASTETPVAVNTACRARNRHGSRVLALGEGLQQAGRAQRLPHQLSERHVQVARARPHRQAAGRRSAQRDAEPDHRRSTPTTFTEEADQTTEDQLGLDRSQRRDVQRRLTGLGFDTKATGKFDDNTRSVITRWQASRGYPVTGYLNALQHKALLGEIVSTRVASADNSSSSSDDDVRLRRRPSLSSQRRRRRPALSRRRRTRRLVRPHDGRHVPLRNRSVRHDPQEGGLRAAFSLFVYARARYNLKAVADAPMSHQEIGQMRA